MHSSKKRELNTAYLFSGSFPLMKEVFITFGSQVSFRQIAAVGNMNTFSVHTSLEAQSIN